MRFLVPMIWVGVAASTPHVIVDRTDDRVVLRTPVGGFETRAPDLDPRLLEAVLGGPGAKEVWAEAER